MIPSDSSHKIGTDFVSNLPVTQSTQGLQAIAVCGSVGGLPFSDPPFSSCVFWDVVGNFCHLRCDIGLCECAFTHSASLLFSSIDDDSLDEYENERPPTNECLGCGEDKSNCVCAQIADADIYYDE